MEYLNLNNGIKCPVIGIGTFMLSPADAENSVREALKMGCRMIDTANAYVNERACWSALGSIMKTKQENPIRHAETFMVSSSL